MASFKEMTRDGTLKRADAMQAKLDDIHEEPGFNLREEGADLDASIEALAVHDLLCISNDIALDPQVSSDAQALIDRGRREEQQEQPVIEQSILDYTKGIYDYLQSTAPAGTADEAFRLPPTPSRNQRQIQDFAQGHSLGLVLQATGQDCGNGEQTGEHVEQPATPEDMKIYKDIADGYRRDVAQQEQPSDSEYARGFADGQKEFAEVAGGAWQTAVIDQLVIHHIYQAAHDTDPRKAVHDLLCISNDIALDPQVSSDAQALVDRGRREAQQEQPANRVYLVATGEVHEGQETYTRHDTPPPLCEYETLFTQAQQDHIADASKMVQSLEADFKNFHAQLCKRFGYAHDPIEWKRDQVSLIEHIAKAQQEQPAQEPVAWLIPSLASFEDAKSVNFSRVEGCTLTDAQLIEKMSGGVLWRAEVFSDGEGVKDKHGTYHAPKPLHTRPAPTQPALSDDDITAEWQKLWTAGALPKSEYAGFVAGIRLVESHCRGGAAETHKTEKPHYKLQKCDDCSGEGETLMFGYDDYTPGVCQTCRGTGKVPVEAAKQGGQ